MPRISESQIVKEATALLERAGAFEKGAYPSLEAYKNDPGARAGSDDLSTIEALYGIKPEQIHEYEDNIMEVAHPNAVVLMPAYDPINGLVENNIERNNVMRYIVEKSPTANYNYHKYAQSELMFELVRIANEMDSKEQVELYKLADECLLDLHSLKKEAFPWLVVGAVVLAGVLAATWLGSHIDDPDKGPLVNADNAIKQLQDLQENSWYESDVDETVKQEAAEIITYIQKLKTTLTDYMQVTNVAYKPHTLNDKEELLKLTASADQHGAQIERAVQTLKSEVTNIEPLLSQAIENFINSDYQVKHTKPSWVSDAVGWASDALHGRWGLIANDFISAANALGTLKKSLKSLATSINGFNEVREQQEARIKQAHAFLKSDEGEAHESEPGESEEKWEEEGGLFNSPESKQFMQFTSSIPGLE